MPWIEKSVMKKKLEFVKDVNSGDLTIAEIARKYGISRKTAYKYIARYIEEGEAGLVEKSRAPHIHPNETPAQIIDEVVNMKLKYGSWGPKKIIARLRKDNPDRMYPCPSTAQYWLYKYDLVKKRRRSSQVPPYTQPFSECNASNDVWSIDFKGQFRMGNGKYCYPLTIEDNYSRFNLLCMGLESPNYENTRKWLHWAFCEYGLPKAIRSDNGTPFVAPGQTGLSQLSIWFIQLGIEQERIDKGHPEQNGRLERFHRTLKDYIKEYPQMERVSQQQLFSTFKHEYNHVRPHEAIDFKTPAELYIPSPRRYVVNTPPPEYGPDMLVRRVKPFGEVSLEWKSYYICKLLGGEYVGLRLTGNGDMEVYYYDRLILRLDIGKGSVHGIQRRTEYFNCVEKKIVHQPSKKSLREWYAPLARYASQGVRTTRGKRKLAKKRDIKIMGKVLPMSPV